MAASVVSEALDRNAFRPIGQSRCRGPVDAGSEAQIDYGRLGMWFDPAPRAGSRSMAFVMVLAFSRHLMRRSSSGPEASTGGMSHIRILRRGCRRG